MTSKKPIVWSMTRIIGGGWIVDGVIGHRTYREINKRACRQRYINEWKSFSKSLQPIR